MTLRELQEKRNRLVTQARASLDEINDNTDESRAAELDRRHDTIMSELDALDAQIEREQRVSALEASIEQRNENEQRNRRDNPGRPNMGGDESRASGGETEAPEYRDAFYSMVLARGLVSEMPQEMRAALAAGEVRASETERRSLSTGSDAAGGYTIPQEMARQLHETMALWGPMYDESICTVMTTTSGNTFDMPTIDDTANEAGDHTEATALTDDGGVDPVFGNAQLAAFMFNTEWVRYSYELAQDSILNMEGTLARLLGKRLGRKANRALTVGSGSSAPNGIVTASALGVTAAAVAAITTDELIELQHSVDPAYRGSPKARFMFHDDVLKLVRKLKNSDGDYIWTQGDIRTGVPGLLLGTPYSVNQAMATPAAGARTAVFGDFSEYIVRKVGGPVMGIRRETYWPDLGIAGIIRLDGELMTSGAVAHLKQAAS